MRKFIVLCKFLKRLVRSSIDNLFYSVVHLAPLQPFLGGKGLNYKVRHENLDMIFVSPNAITRYRSESFSTKEPETLIWLDSLKPGSVLWDIGANVGLYSIYAAKKIDAKVYAFEPSVFNLELLARNIFINDLQHKIIIVPIALNDETGANLFKMSNTSWGGALSTFASDFDQNGNTLKSIFEYSTLSISMDEAVSSLGLLAPNYIKMDVDGIEHLILRGGYDVLKSVDSVLIEINDDFTEQAEEAARHLQAAGLVLSRKCDAHGSQSNRLYVRNI